MKTCTKCKNKYEATAENFGPDKRASDGFQSQCRVCHRGYGREYYRSDKYRACLKKYRQSEKGQATTKRYKKEYHATVNGHLHSLFDSMTGRCSHKESYTNKGIRNNFKSPDGLIDYVTNELQVDPRGLDCHRIDDDGHYERGNIEFLTSEEHIKLHRGIKQGVIA